MNNPANIKKQKGKYQFTYAVITDTHLNENEEECNSPFDVNRRANRRLRYVIDDLNKRDLAMVLHLGDVVHPVPSMGILYAESAARFHEQMSSLKHPLHIIPGNHDVGDKYIPWGPAGTVNDEFLAAWTEHFGDHYFEVKHNDVVFIGINAQLIGSGLKMEQEQKSWLESTLKKSKNQRIYIFTHYPPFLADKDESEHYDNLSNKGRKWLLDLIEKYNIEALFAGHVHHFWYNQVGDCQCYLLPSTAFTRQDYSEMFRVEPSLEFGRNDSAKLGYLLVHVHENGHFIEMVRCYGNEQSPNHTNSCQQNKDVSAVNAVTNSAAILGFDLRQDWAEMVQIPPSGGLDEFDRKWVRNDYALLALWEMGVKSLRIPFADIIDLNRRKRMQEMTNLGFEFNLFSFGIPLEVFKTELSESISSLISSWEISWPVDELDDLMPSIKRLTNIDCELTFSALRSKADILESGRTYYHVINHGYTASDKYLTEQLNDTLSSDFSGYVLRCGFEESVWNTVKLAAKVNQQTNLKSSVHLRLAADNPAQNLSSESFICARLTESIISGWLFNIDSIYCDTLADNDRGYFPRSGVLDRLYNPKSGFHIVKNIHSFLSGLEEQVTNFHYDEIEGNKTISINLNSDLVLIIVSSSQRHIQSTINKELNSKIATVSRLLWKTGKLENIDTANKLINDEKNWIEGISIEILTFNY